MFRDYSDCSEELKEEIRRIKFKPYYEIANELKKAIKTISNISESQIIRWAYIKQLKLELTALLYDKRLDEFTTVYKDTKPSTKVNVDYDHNAVTKFAIKMQQQFPYEDPANTLLTDIITFLTEFEHKINEFDSFINEYTDTPNSTHKAMTEG